MEEEIILEEQPMVEEPVVEELVVEKPAMDKLVSGELEEVADAESVILPAEEVPAETVL